MLLQLGLIAVNAVFASAEIALISVHEAKLELLAAQGDRRAKKLLALTRQPARFLATIQVGITLAGFLGSAFAAENFSERLVGLFNAAGAPLPLSTLKTIAVVIITIILSFFTLILGELVPKRIALKKAEPLAFCLASFIFAISQAFSPLVWLLTRSTNALLRLLRINPETEEQGVTEEEIRMLVDAGTKRGTIDAGETEIIHKVFEFGNTSAVEVMTHRTHVILLWLRESDAEWERRIRENRHHYYPICGETQDAIVGLLNARDYFWLEDRSRQRALERAVRPAYCIPESVKIDVLFRRMQESRNHIAVVVDEYGGMSGLVTMHDLLTELVGSLEDDAALPTERPFIEKLDPQVWRVQGALPLDKLERALGVKLPEALPVQQYDTFGGFVFSLLGEVPQDGEQAEVAGYGLHITLESVQDRRLLTALVRVTGGDPLPGRQTGL